MRNKAISKMVVRSLRKIFLYASEEELIKLANRVQSRSLGERESVKPELDFYRTTRQYGKSIVAPGINTQALPW